MKQGEIKIVQQMKESGMTRLGEWKPRTPEERLDRLESIAEIRQLATLYALAIDSRDMEALVELFAPDVQVGGGASGRVALQRWFTEVLSHMRTTIHFVGNHVIRFSDADNADGVVYCHDQLDRPDFGTWDVGDLQYWDTYVRVDDKWCFSRRRFNRWYLVDVSDRPGHGSGVNSGHDPLYAKQLPDAYPSWHRYWENIDGAIIDSAACDDLPG